MSRVMRKAGAILISSLVSLGASAQMARTVYVDAVGNNGPSNWNNLEFTVLNRTAVLKDSNELPTGIRAIITSRMDGTNSSATNNPTGDAAEFKPAGTNGTHGHPLTNSGFATAYPLGACTLSNLNPNVSYDFTFYASRMADDGIVRSTLYTVTGANSGSAELDATSNYQNVASVPGITPTPDGVIVIRVEAAPSNTEAIHFYYITALKITYIDPDLSPGKRLLFFGNSFSQVDDVPGRVASLAFLAGQQPPLVVADLMGGEDLAYHIGEVDANAAANVTSPLLAGTNTWDYVIMQGYSTEATHLRDASVFRANALTLFQRVKNHASGKGAGVQPVLFQTWARAPGHSFYPTSFSSPAAMQQEIRSNYQAAAELIQAAEPDTAPRIAPVGDAFERGSFSPARLYASDLYHAGNCGPALAALVLYKTIYDAPVTNIAWETIYQNGWTTMSSNDWERVTCWAHGIQTPSHAAASTPHTVYIDPIGSDGPNNWNNLSFNTLNDTRVLVDALTNSTGIRATVKTRLNGSNTNASSSPTGDAAEFAPAGSNSAFGHTSVFNGTQPILFGEVVFSNMNPAVAYTFTFYASRMSASNIRDARYVVAGANSGETVLNASNNSSETVTVADIFPDADGVVTLRIELGPDNNDGNGFFYITAMKFVYAEPPPRQVYVDAFTNDAAHPLPPGWNLLDMTGVNAAALVDDDGVATGIKGLVTGSCSGSNWGNYTPVGDAAEFAPAWSNGSYTQNDNTSTFTLYNLMPDRPYTFTFFGNRPGVTDNRTTRYIVTGANVGTNELDVTANTANVAVVSGIRPRADRTIQVTFRKGTGNTGNYNYLTAWKLSYPENGLPAPDYPPIGGKRILIFGNNLFSQDNIPNMLANLAAAAGHPRPLVVADTASGRTLAQSATRVNSATLSYLNIQHPDLTGTNTWDEVVMQGDFIAPTHLGDPAAYSANLNTLWSAVKNHSSGKGASAHAVVFQTFAHAAGHACYPDDFADPAAMQAEIDANTASALADLLAADPASGARLAPVGDAFAFTGFEPALYASNLQMPANVGPELVALVLYKTIYGQSARDIPYEAADSAGVNGISEPDWIKVTHWADGLAAPVPQPPAPGSKLTWLIDACSNTSGSPSYLGWNDVPFHATGLHENLVYTNGAPSEVSLDILERMSARSDNSVTAVSGDAAIFAKALRNNAYGNIGKHSDSTYSNEFCVARFNGLWPGAAYTFTIYGSRSNAGHSRETKYIVEGVTSGEALLECNNNTSDVVVIPRIRPRPDGTIDLRITAGPNNASGPKYYHINALMLECTFGGTTFSVR